MLALVAYDISDDRRRHRVSTHLAARGARVQFSVFECELATRADFDDLAAEVDAMIDHHDDQVRFYPLTNESDRNLTVLGQRRIEERQDFYIV